MATILYLDVDDEITSAAARMRSADDGPLGLVVPPGSRVATSRINFRLLAREAQSRGRSLSIVAGDAATRALAASAGLATFASVGEYEASFETPAGDGQDDGGDGRRVAASRAGLTAAGGGVAAAGDVAAGSTAGTSEAAEAETGTARSGSAPAEAERSKRTRRGDLEATAVVAPKSPPVVGPAGAAGREPGERTSALPVVGPRRRLPGGRPMLVGVAVLLVALVVGGVAAFVFLPSATITLTPRIEAIGPVTLEVRADPTATRPDAVAAVVPAERLSFDFSAAQSFPATGTRVEETKATGEVTFQNCDTGREHAVGAGSVVSTESGIKFVTNAAVTIERASFPIFACKGASVGVTAAAAGPAGNVPAGSITRMSSDSPDVLTVRNDQATSGGARTEFPRVQQADVTAAVEQLTAQLREQFDTRLADPAAAPEGMTLFPDTRALGTPSPAVDPASLVGQEVATFELTMTAVGEVTAVDERPLASVGEEHIRDQVDADHRLVDGSIAVEVGDAAPDGASLVFPVTVRAAQVRILDRDALLAEIRGRPITQARAILEPYGAVELSVWPDWVTAVPTIDGRATLTIADASGEATPSPGSTGAPATRPSAAPASPSTVPSPEGSAPTGSAP